MIIRPEESLLCDILLVLICIFFSFSLADDGTVCDFSDDNVYELTACCQCFDDGLSLRGHDFRCHLHELLVTPRSEFSHNCSRVPESLTFHASTSHRGHDVKDVVFL